MKDANGHGQNVSAAARFAPHTDVFLDIDPEKTITPRQLELLALYASGYSYERIGSVKFLSPYTVRNTLKSALVRSGARNLTHLCVVLIEKRLIRKTSGEIYEPIPDLRVVGE